MDSSSIAPEEAAAAAACCLDARLAWDVIGGATRQVCLSCGALSGGETYEDESAGGTTFTFASGRSVATSERLASQQRERISRGALGGLRRIRALCASLQCDDAMRRECEAAYQSALARDELRCKGRPLKDAVAAACVYLKMRERDLPITLTSMANLLPPSGGGGGGAFELGAAFKTLVGLLGISVPPVDTVDVVRAALSSSAAAASRFSADDVAAIARLVELLRDLWVTAGRRHNTVILGAAFVYERLRRGGGAPSLMIGAFLKQFDANASRQQTGQVAKEAERVLLSCCSRLPWMRGVPVDMRAVASNLDQIFRFKQTVLRSEAAAASAAPQPGTSSCGGGEGVVVSDELLAAALEPYERHAADVAVKLGRMSDPELGESDIPESELDKFIRSPAEASDLAEALAAMENPAACELDMWQAAAVVSRKRKAHSRPNEAAS